MKNIELYSTEDNYCPFKIWFESLDKSYQLRILKRINRMRDGNFGDWKHLQNSQLCEMRLFFGKGYRIYFKELDCTIVLIIAGGDKSNQEETIRLANSYFNEYLNRSKTNEHKI